MATPLDQVVYISEVMQAFQHTLKPLVGTATPLLFWGETGTGMGFLARMIHASSHRSGAFVKIPGFMLDDDTVLPQFIGQDDQPGWLEEADNGTIFLKRISEAAFPAQKMLLSLISHQSVDGRLEFSRKGRTEKIVVNVRFLYSMAHDYKTALQDKLFSRNLADFIETHGKVLRVPALRERPEDLAGIAQNFLHEFNRKYGRAVTDIDAAALDVFSRYIWPGNIDELKRVLENLFIQYPDLTVITPAQIPEQIASAQLTGTEYSFKLKNDVRFKGQIRAHVLKIQSGNRRLKLNTHDLAEIVRVDDSAFTPPKFKHFLVKFKDGDQIAGTLLDKTLKVATSFDADYEILLQDVESIYLV